jgi:adenylyltransferase/sulfurtransferase
VELTDTQIHRYARHILLREIGGQGQTQLLQSKVLVIGAGGLGTPLLLYLAAAGVGTIGIVDNDRVELSNLQRQVVHDTTGIGQLKVASAAERLALLNPDVQINPWDTRLNASNAIQLVTSYDIVADGSDNFQTRYLLADACHLSQRTLVSGALLQFNAQLFVGKAFTGAGYPCYRCLYPSPGEESNCSDVGVVGALAGVVGALQALEVIKEILGIGRSLAGHLLLIDALTVSFRTLVVSPDPDCPLCGTSADIQDLSHHA